MENLNVIYISYDGLSDPVGVSQIVPYVRELAKNGVSFSVISFEKSDLFDLKKESIKKQFENLPISWYPCKYTKNPPIISTMIDLSKMKKLCKKICKEKKIDFIHARSYIPAMCAKKLFNKKNIPFIFDMRGFWADERVDGNIWSLKNPLFYLVFKFFKHQEKLFLKKSKTIVSLTHSGKELIHKNWNIPAEKIHVIPCAADYELFNKTKVNSDFREKYNIPKPEGKTLIYVGSTGTWYMIKEMIDFYLVFREKFPKSQFVFCVNSTHDAILEGKKMLPDEIFSIEQVARNEMPAALSLADYSILFIKPAFSKIASSPIKLGESLAMGIPAICNANVGDLSDTEKSGFGIVVENFENQEYIYACNRLSEYHFDANEIREKSAEIYELENNINKYLNVYKLMK